MKKKTSTCYKVLEADEHKVGRENIRRAARPRTRDMEAEGNEGRRRGRHEQRLSSTPVGHGSRLLGLCLLLRLLLLFLVLLVADGAALCLPVSDAGHLRHYLRRLYLPLRPGCRRGRCRRGEPTCLRSQRCRRLAACP
jgi:hypothetical protein